MAKLYQIKPRHSRTFYYIVITQEDATCRHMIGDRLTRQGI